LSLFKNTLLRNLDAEIIGRLSLRPVKFELRHDIEFPGRPIDHLFFVEEGMASMTTTFDDGSQVEVGMFGYESVIGVSALMGTKASLNRIYTQIEGCGFSCTVETARKEFRRGAWHEHKDDQGQDYWVRDGQFYAIDIKTPFNTSIGKNVDDTVPRAKREAVLHLIAKWKAEVLD
jgi:hypothetical protein